MTASLSHASRVLRLYRQALTHSRSWAIDRTAWRQQAVALRARFDAHASERNPLVAGKLLVEGEVCRRPSAACSVTSAANQSTPAVPPAASVCRRLDPCLLPIAQQVLWE